MRTKWLIGIGLAAFLAMPFALAQEPEKEVSGDQLKKQEQVKAQDQAQEQIQNQKKAQEKSQSQNQNQGSSGDGEKGAMKRGQHRYRHLKALGTANQQGEGAQTRAGKGFGEGFVDSDGNGVCDNYQKRKGQR